MAADDKKKEDLFVSHIELGYIETKGNTNTKTFNLDGKVTKELDKHNFKLTFDGQYATDSGSQIKNKYKIVGDYLYQYWETLSFGYVIGYKVDKFSGFKYQLATGPLAKWKAYTSDKQKLSFDISALYSADRVEEDLTQMPPVYAETIDYASAAAALDYEWQILENLKFTEYATYRVDLEDGKKYFVFSKTAFSSKISDMFSAGVSYKVDYVNQPPSDKQHADRTFAVNLIIDY